MTKEDLVLCKAFLKTNPVNGLEIVNTRFFKKGQDEFVITVASVAMDISRMFEF